MSLGFFAMSSWAQGGDSTEFVLEEVTIVSGLFEEKIVDFGGAVSALDFQQINAGDELTLQPVLNAIPGVYMQSGTLSTNRITIRGIGARSPFGTDKIKAYLDEIPLSTGEGETTIEDVDFATLEQIEVFRGPTSTIYGAGLGGAIRFQTLKPEGFPKASVEAMFGSFGLRQYRVSGQVADDKRSLNLLYQDVHSDGYRDNNTYDRQSITLLGQSVWQEHSEFTLYANYTFLESFIPSSLGVDDYEDNPEQAASSWGDAEGKEDSERFRAGLTLKTNYSSRTESHVTLFVNGSKASEVRPSFLGNLTSDQLNTGIRAKVRRSFLADEQLQVVLGVEGFLESYRYREFVNDAGQNGDKTLDLDQQRNYGNVFVATEYYPSDQWILTLGANMNWSQYDLHDQFNTGTADQSGGYGFEPVFSPKVSIVNKLSDDFSAYALVSHGFSLPSFEQTLYPGGQVNKDLKPESGWNYEFGLKGDVIKRKLYAEIVGYAMYTEDLIVNREENQVTIGVNAGSARHYGLEILIDHEIWQSPMVRVDQRLSYALMGYHFADFVDGEEDYSGNRMTGVPNYTLDYTLRAQMTKGFFGHVNLQAVGSRTILDDASLQTDAYYLLNAKVGYQRAFGQLDLSVYLGGNNLSDTRYASMLLINASSQRYYYPGLPINYYSGVKAAYRF
ncbi:TonB-dependent receptor [Reichenbachiella sp. MSK19-1]|uniref:TonB-dependent receptor n=1 Tax=Reichenbachiella sp. MSK19-1 TaxID=1897631 RepID=UPI0013149C86|nr:TonB-dependent receptor [Reichenbachiella sp. MSK19-1]